MKLVAIMLWALIFCCGCASQGGKGQWDEFWKDLRGDNMKMSTDYSPLRN